MGKKIRNKNSKAKNCGNKNLRSNLRDKDFKNNFWRKKIEVNILEAKLNNIWELNFGIKLSQQLKLGKEEKIKKRKGKKIGHKCFEIGKF